MMHKALDATFPEEDFQVDSTLKAIKRQLAGTPFQTLPITPEILGQLYLFIDTGDPEQLAFWCSILTGFRCLLRKSNLVPVSLDKFDPLTGLTRSKIMLPEDKDVALVYLNWSKTNQFGARETVIPMVADSVSALDPVWHLKLLFSSNILPDTLPAFSFVPHTFFLVQRFSSPSLCQFVHTALPHSQFVHSGCFFCLPRTRMSRVQLAIKLGSS